MDILKHILYMLALAVWENRDALPNDWESPLEYTLRQ